MKAWIVAAAVLSIATVGLALPEDASPVHSAAACEANIACAASCHTLDTICYEACVTKFCGEVKVHE